MTSEILHGDCLDLMKDIPDNSVDMICVAPPYGTTKCAWDIIIPFEHLWKQYKRIIKKNGAIVIFGKEPFSSFLRLSNLDWFKYDWVWKKTKAMNFAQSKNSPLMNYEMISIFSEGKIAHLGKSRNRMVYNPQGRKIANKEWKRKSYNDKSDFNFHRPSHKLERIIEFENLPSSIIDFGNGNNNRLHPTQKPVALFEYLIQTYTNEGDLVMDTCAGSGTTAIACLNTNRKYICIEKDENYFNIMKNRIENHT